MNKNIFTKSVAFFLLFMFSCLITYSQEQVFVEQLVESLSVDSPKEIHITSSVDAISEDVTISLNHEDAWLFFENVRPSEVASKYFGNIKINNANFNDGANGRMAIYAHGTVIMPHGSNFKPLTVYTEQNFQGESNTYNLHVYNNKLGDFNAAIRSLKLKRGYQATFATNSDGSGYSRVFIADQEDIELPVLPELLDGTIAFIRVFKHQWVTKKGWCGWNGNDFVAMDVTWYYDWNVGGNTSQNFEYTPIKQHGHWPSWTDINNKTNVSQVLGYNEPDRPDQANLKFDDAFAMWPEIQKSGLRIGSPATSDPFNGWSLYNFIDKCDEVGYRVDYVAIHAYWAKSPQQWYNDLKHIHNRTGRPIWITEWNNGANWTNEWWPDGDRSYTPANAEKQLNDLKKILEVLDTTSFVERYAIYNWVEDARAMTLGDGTTLAGEYYANNKSTFAYNSKNEVIPIYKYKNPELTSLVHVKRQNGMRVNFDTNNGNLAREVVVQKRTKGKAFEDIYTTTDASEKYYIDPIDAQSFGEVIYRVGIKDVYGNYIYSNETAYFQTEGNDLMQIGHLPVVDFDWKTTFFSEDINSLEPEVILSPIYWGQGGLLPTATRAIVNSRNSSDIKIIVEPWQYLSNPIVPTRDSISLLAMPAGVYNFGGLKAEVGRTPARVLREWVHIEFEQSFDKVPVVFTTQISSAASFPTVVSVQNVTKDGFEVKIKSEEAVTSLFLGDFISFLAVEPGKGHFNNKRLKVGKPDETSKIAGDPVTIDYDESYSEAILFANFQSDNNRFASNLKYYEEENSTNQFILMRHKEMSGRLSPNIGDEYGWMVMDISKNQEDIVSINNIYSEILDVFPNPFVDIISINVNKAKNVSIFAVSGNLVFRGQTDGVLDLSLLNSGVYFVEVEGYGVQKIVKK